MGALPARRISRPVRQAGDKREPIRVRRSKNLFRRAKSGREAVFEPEIIQVMAGAYEELLGDLELLDRNDPFTEVVAKEVIEAARLGLHDVPAMRQWVLDTLGKPH